ncbi:MAG: carboxypeptidase regulatory-like domain-containing protein, partial [Bacteroidota bacterium]
MVDGSGNALVGATVVAIHTPSGSKYGNLTNEAGMYRIPNMRIGGPYSISISYVGYQTYQEEGIYLTLGQTFRLSATLLENAVNLGEVEITSSRSDVFDGNRTGQETVITEDDINALPTISRSIADFVRVNPLVSVNEGNDGFSFSIGGQNNRYNAIYIDGSVNNDVFGLAGSGTDGGQTGAPPISLDAIEQFQVSVAPFDVRLSGFAGGAVNTVTRSGTNKVEASAYYFLRNQNLAGRTPRFDGIFAEDTNRTTLNDFTAQTFGFRVGGPVIKDKLFFFVNGEFQRDQVPDPFDFADYNGDATDADLTALRTRLSEFGYDPGTFTENASTLDRNFVLAKLDYNINENHKASLRYFVNDIENLEARSSSATFLGFQNGSESFPSRTHNATFELNSLFGNTFSNQFKLGFKSVRDDRDVFGTDFPWVSIVDGDGAIEFGGERFSTANRLDTDVFTISDEFQIFLGKHSITLGTQNEFYSVGNLFIRENFGAYRYNGLTDTLIENGDTTLQFVPGLQQFLDGRPATRYDRSYSQVDNVAGDESDAIAAFSGFTLGFFVQDEFQVNENFKLTAGLRLDINAITTDVPVNETFNDETIKAIQEAGYDLRGARTGQFIDPQFQLAPRVGFNWNVNGENKTQVRGGVGIFNSRQPLVWFGGAFNNYGLNIGGTRRFDQVVFDPNVQNQVPGNIDLNNPTPAGQIDLFDENFRLPQVAKLDLAVDQKLGGGFVFTAEGLFTRFLNNIRYESLNLKPSTETLTGTGDDRPIYNVFDEVDDTYTGIFLATNTNKGYAYNLAATIMKPVPREGLGGSLSYSYGDAFTINDGTSSQNNSQWRGFRNVEGKNFEGDPQRSNFAAGHRVFGALTYRFEYGKAAATAITLAYNGQSGGAYTYTIRTNGFGGMVNDGAFNNGEPFYIPTDQNDIILQEVDGFTADQQYQVLNDYIEASDYLSGKRGEYVTRNSSRVPFTNIFDLKVAQDIFVTSGAKRNTLQLTADIFNFGSMVGNLFDQEWGRIYRNGSFGNVTLVNFEGFEDGTNTPIYSVNDFLLDGETPWEGNFIDT